MSIEIDLANAVVTELNDPARSWFGKFTAKQDWLPVNEPEDLDTLQVVVMSLTLDNNRESRSIWKEEYGLGIDFQQKVNREAMPEAANTLTEIAAAVYRFYKDGHPLAGMTDWKVMKPSRPDIYNIARLYRESIWETFIPLVVRGYA